ncbi:MAG: OadG family transporter subunit [Fermentimonas sp.]
MRFTKILIYLFISFTVLTGCSKKINKPGWVINEVMVTNESNYVDNFGKRSGWIEIYNYSAATMDLGGRYLTNDPNNPTKYHIPRGDVLTQVKPHQHALFFADNSPFNGTFHLNFELDPTKENYIALYDNDGRTLIDEITIPANIPANKTYGYPQDGIKYDENLSSTASILDRVTPSSNNTILEENPKIVMMRETDSWGIMLTITSMLVVFAALIGLYIFFRTIGVAAQGVSKRKVAREGTLSAVRSQSELSGEVLAAISAAIYEMSEDHHDIENTILTINQVKRNYSPWSSKAHSLRQLPRR